MKSVVGSVALLMVCLCGCQPAHVQELTKKMWTADVATVPEFEEVWAWADANANRKPGMSHTYFMREAGEQEIESQQTGAPLALAGGNLATLVKDAGFQSRLKALEDAKLPSGLATPEREEAKQKYLKEWRNLEKLLTTGGKTPDIKKSMERLDLYAAQIRFIPGQNPPTGEAAKSFSGVQPYEDPFKKPVP
jgi:hypothetical protein